MCFKQPNVVATNRYYHEGFTVPPCDASMVQDVPDMSSDDLYDWGMRAFQEHNTDVFLLGEESHTVILFKDEVLCSE